MTLPVDSRESLSLVVKTNLPEGSMPAMISWRWTSFPSKIINYRMPVALFVLNQPAMVNESLSVVGEVRM